MGKHELAPESSEGVLSADQRPTRRYNVHGEWAMEPSALAAHMEKFSGRWKIGHLTNGAQSIDADVPGLYDSALCGSIAQRVDVFETYLKKFGDVDGVATPELPGASWLRFIAVLPFKRMRADFMAAVADMRAECQEASSPEERALAVRDGRWAMVSIVVSSI